jgi:dihydrofolate reductase
LATAPLADEIQALLASTGNDVEIGGAALAGQAFQLGLIEDIRIFRHPVVLGGGTPFFPSTATTAQLELLETRSFEPGIIFEHYRVCAERTAGGVARS